MKEKEWVKMKTNIVRHTKGCGMVAAREIASIFEKNGFETYFYDTTDFQWPYRKPRVKKDGLSYVITVWAGKRNVRPDWRFLAVKRVEGIDVNNNIDELIKNTDAYFYGVKLQ